MAGNDERQLCQRCRGSGQVMQDKGMTMKDEKGRERSYTIQVMVMCGSCGGTGGR